MHLGNERDLSGSPFAGEQVRPSGSVVALRAEIPPAELVFLQGTQQRMVRTMMVIGLGGAAVAWLLGGWKTGAGFAVGATISILNFHWLKSAANLLAEAFSSVRAGDAPTRRPNSVWIIARFVFRYALLGMSAYVIFLSSAISLKAFLLGLFVFVAGLMVEAGYQVLREFKIGAGNQSHGT